MLVNQHWLANLKINAMGSIFTPNIANLIGSVKTKELVEGVVSDAELLKVGAHRSRCVIQSVRDCLDAERVKRIFPNGLEWCQEVTELAAVSRLHWKRTKVGIRLIHPIIDNRGQMPVHLILLV